MNTFRQLENIRKQRGTAALALIDPDVKNDGFLMEQVQRVQKAEFDGILIGGSLIMDDRFEERIRTIKDHTDLPVVIFPGSSRQLSGIADAVLYLSLLSGRNPQYLIGEQVQSAPVIHHLNLEVIPTGYLLLDGGAVSSVQVMSNTNPLPMEKCDIILAHALAGQYMGMKTIFLEAGSGARHPADIGLVAKLKAHLTIPLIVGGGVRSAKTAGDLARAGAGYIVIGTALENEKSTAVIGGIVRAIHHH